MGANVFDLKILFLKNVTLRGNEFLDKIMPAKRVIG